jgi:lipopolysaccharide/colanic/teichoic acid biosynthesis glycosyltransferase
MKRVFDIAVSGALLVLLSPMLVAIALLVRWRLGKPVIFRQIRPGLHGKPFTIYKFRTMAHPGEDESTDKQAEAKRLSHFGRRLRASSFDELPELWNVLKGDMSLVGPRPLLMQYLELYTPTQARRHEVRPGLTGWAQVNGRNLLDWDARFEHDVWYVDHRTFRLDLEILARTLRTVVRRDGVTPSSLAIMPTFTGSKKRADP